MKNRGKKLAMLALCGVCVMTQAMPVYATEGAKTAVETVLRKTGNEALQTAKEAVLQEEMAGMAADDAASGQESGTPEDGKADTGESQQPGGPGSTPGESQQPGGPGSTPDDPQQPDDPGSTPDDPQQPDDPNNPDDPQPPDEPQLPAPKKPKGLHTTCQSDTKVLLEWDQRDDAASYQIYRKTGNGSYRKLASVKKERYTDKSVVYGKTYRYRIVPLNADGVSGTAAEIAFSHTQAVNIKKQKYTYNEMKKDMEELAKAYSNYCELSSIGTSVEGRAIYDFAIGNPEAKKSLLVVSTLHAREYICSATLMREIEFYLRNYNQKISGTKPANLLKNIQIHYIVMANPDGVTISQTTYPRWKSNARGVDLNRNFPVKKFNVGGKKGAEGYSGKKALSEPESKAVATLTKKLKNKQSLLGVVNYHAMGQIIYGDCISGSAKLKANTQKMYSIANRLTGYRSAGSNTSRGNTVGGQYREYVMYMLGLPSITLEIGATIAPCSFYEYHSAFEKNKLVVLKIAEAL